jgi:DNA-binding response OmpR family regulator
MPVMDGFMVLEQMQLKGMLHGMPVIVISAETEQEYVKRSYEMGAKEYLARPFDFVIVRQRVKNVISLASDKVTA